MTKLTYEEYKKAVQAGFITGSACCCVGPENNEEFCPCSMNLLDKLTEEGRAALAQEWRDKEAERRSKFVFYEDQLPRPKTKLDELTEKRLARQKALGLK